QRGTQTFRIVGVVVDYTTDLGTVIIERGTYQRYWGDERVDVYKLYAKEGADLEAIRQSIVSRFGERYNLFVLTNSEIKREILSLLDQVFAVMRALDLVAILIAVLGVVNALLASVLDRIREIGVLRAIGMLRRQTRKMIMI